MIKAVMIDVDGVLVTGRPVDGSPWATDLFTDLNLAPSVLHRAFFEPHWEQIITGKVTIRERLAQVLHDIAPELTPDTLLAYWFRNDARLDEQLLQDLAKLRVAGLQVHLVTNQEHERASYLMNALGLAAHVDGCHYSAALGHRKPFPEFFHAVRQRVGFQPDELLLVDDQEQNVLAATEAGWAAHLWTPGQTLRSAMPDVVENRPWPRRSMTGRSGLSPQ
ncbi:HAD family hydrolase [Acidisoma cladoniae]|jgi:putative hydrolase of the HAD superfamily|uniref:HAD family hydrolase n=1 Tax=Acidisoma cladoniae TaxID=3040935 RepID=UPI00254FEBDA|nr:HAD-IA family hydrolase [Acidisoma sp. PAMC 29798]